MGSGIANFGMKLTSDIGVVDLILDETSRSFLDCLEKFQLSVVGVMVLQTIRTHGKVHVHTIWHVHNNHSPVST